LRASRPGRLRGYEVAVGWPAHEEDLTIPTIGTCKLIENGRFEGTLGTLTVRARLSIVPVSAKTSDDQPDYRVYAGRIEVGAGWRKTSDRGDDYVSLVLDGPSFAARLYAALMPADEPDSHRLVWSGPKRNDN
jgi:uncharacterized protein (DUF736 family)